MNENKFGSVKKPLKLKSNAAKLVDDKVVDNLDERKNMGKKLAIKGHSTRGKEVIELLEMMGGHCPAEMYGLCENRCYSIKDNGWVGWDYIGPEEIDKYNIFTLEEFLKNYPFKVGDKCVVLNSNKVFTIDNIVWDDALCTVHYYNSDDIEYYTAKEIILKSGVHFDSICVQYFDKDYPNNTSTQMKDNKANGSIIDFSLTEKIELDLGNTHEIIIEDGKTYVVRKKPKITEDQLLDIGFSKCRKSKSCDPDYAYTGPGDFYALDMWLWINPDENFWSIRYNDFTVYPCETKNCVVYNIDAIKDIIDLQYSCLTKYREVANKFKLKVSILELIKNKK